MDRGGAVVVGGSGGGAGDELVDDTGCGAGEVKLLASGGGAARDSAGEGALDNAVIDVGGSVGWFEGGSIGVRPAVVVDSESNGGSVTSNLARRSSTMA